MTLPPPSSLTRRRETTWRIVSAKHEISKLVAEHLGIFPPRWVHVGSKEQLDGVGIGAVILVERATWRQHPHHSCGLIDAIDRAENRGAQRVDFNLDGFKGKFRSRARADSSGGAGDLGFERFADVELMDQATRFLDERQARSADTPIFALALIDHLSRRLRRRQ